MTRGGQKGRGQGHMTHDGQKGRGQEHTTQAYQTVCDETIK